MSPGCFQETACAVCAWLFPVTEVFPLLPTSAMLQLLQNDCIRADLLPTSYDLNVYGQAILRPEGMSSLQTPGVLRVCNGCQNALRASPGCQLRFVLTNFLYYATDRLPWTVLDAFEQLSPFDLMLISQCRSSTVTHHFVRHGSQGGYIPEECAQRFNRGNVAIFPQDPGLLRDVLPPSSDDVRDTMCILFTGGFHRPSVEMLKRFGPVLVSKSKVQTMIDFLVNNNEWYQFGGVQYSKENMESLLKPVHKGSDVGILRFLQVEHAEDGDAADEGGDVWVDAQDEMVMDNVTYTMGNYLPRSHESIKAHALVYALDRNRFLNSQAGTDYISDNHPGFLSYLFPQLDPWGIDGFNHPGRTASQRLLFECQVKCLLRQYRSPFVRNPMFAFICWNIIQKQLVS